MADVFLADVSKSFDQGKSWVVKNINLAIDDGEFVAFVGPSGCGKSTLLRLVCGLEEISAGDLRIGHERVNDMPPNERGVGMVFQSYALYPHMTVRENMAFGLKLAKMDKQTINKRVNDAAKILQLEPLLDRKPKAMSGGQRQRVALGRSIVQEPRVFLFDEPLSNLDVALRVQMRQELSRLHRRLQTTSIYVTHDQVEAMTLADKVVVLSPLAKDADTNLEQVGPPLVLFHRPANLFVAGFIGSPKMNFFNGTLVDTSEDVSRVRLNGGDMLTVAVDTSSATAGDAVVLGIRPQDVHLAEGGKGHVEGTVMALERLGTESFIYLSHQDIRESFIVRVEDSRYRHEGDIIQLQLPEESCHLFDAHGRSFSRTRVSDVN